MQSQLNFDADKKKQISRHYWHSFPAKFPPDLPKIFIESLTDEKNIILDPMAGSCTTLIEAANLNRIAYGFDIDPLSLIIGKAKLQNFDVDGAKVEGIHVLRQAQAALKGNDERNAEKLYRRFDTETLKFLDYWFLKQTQLELLALIEEIEAVQDKSIQQVLKLVFSSIIITKSGGVTMSMDLAHTRPHKVLTKRPNSAFAEFLKKLNRITNNDYLNLRAKANLEEGNAKNIALQNQSIDLIVTSPPYANNAIDYMRAHKFSLVWFGYSISELKHTRKKYIGSETVENDHLIPLPLYVENVIRKLSLVNKNKSKALHRYYFEMYLVLQEMFRLLKQERAFIIVVATSILNGVDVETHICLGELGKAIGFELVHIGERVIHRDSRMLPTSHLKNNSQIEARMHTEAVIGLWKPII